MIQRRQNIAIILFFFRAKCKNQLCQRNQCYWGLGSCLCLTSNLVQVFVVHYDLPSSLTSLLELRELLSKITFNGSPHVADISHTTHGCVE